MEVVTATETGSRVVAEAAHPTGRKGARPFLIVHRLPSEKSHFRSVGSIPFESPVKYLLDNWHKIQPDLIHVHDFESLQIGLMLKTAKDRPLVLTVHRTPKEPDPSLPHRDPKSCYLKFVRLYGLADVVVAPSQAYKDHLIAEGFPEDRVRLIDHGVPVRKLAAVRPKRGVLERLGLAPDDKFVLCPIRLDPHKGAETFIEAAALVKNRLGTQGLVFAIAGSGDSVYRTKLEKQAREQGVENVLRLGATDGVDFLPDEMPTLYSRATLCVLPSRREGFGQVLLEASAFKCPVLGANTGGIPELMKPYETGLLFNRDEPHDLADQLCTLLQ
ncbi:MAG: glycosyltransferase family 4 protein, partial [Pyrinomonadaceae bacterium]